MNIGQDMFDVMPYVSGVYSDSQNTFDINVNILESDKSFRISSRDRLIGSSSSGTIIENNLVKRGGKITIGGKVYRIDKVHAGAVPGLTDLKLERIEGTAILAGDARCIVPQEEVVIFEGVEIPAHINRSVEVEELGRNGTRKIVSRIMVAIDADIAETMGIKSGSRITVDGRERTTARVMDDGVGLVKVLI